MLRFRRQIPAQFKRSFPSDIFSWAGPTEHLTRSSPRIAAEQKWYAVTGRIVDLRAEADGDLHIALADATGDKPGIIVAEIPAKPQWCELRTTVFSWTHPTFPFRVRSGRKLKITQPPAITVDWQSILRHQPCSSRSGKPENRS